MNNNLGFELIRSIIDTKRNLDLIREKGKLAQGEYLVLRRIKVLNDRNEDELMALNIANNLSMRAPHISRILNSLENKGFIIRSINKTDRRSVSIQLTSLGSKQLETTNKRINEFANRLVNHLGYDNTNTLISLLGDVSTFLQEIKED